MQVHDVPVPPDGGWGWVIVLSSFICNFIVDGICYTFGVFLDSYVIYFNSGKGTDSWAGSLLAGVYLSCGTHLQPVLINLLTTDNPVQTS